MKVNIFKASTSSMNQPEVHEEPSVAEEQPAAETPPEVATPPKPSLWKRAKDRAPSGKVAGTTVGLALLAGTVTGLTIDEINDSDVMKGPAAAGCQVISPGDTFQTTPAAKGTTYAIDITHAKVEQGTAEFSSSGAWVNGSPSVGNVQDGEDFEVAGPPRVLGENVDSEADRSYRMELDLEGGRAFVSATIVGNFKSNLGSYVQNESVNIAASVPLPSNGSGCYIIYDGEESARVEITQLAPSDSPEAVEAAERAIKDLRFNPTQQMYEKAFTQVWNVSADSPSAQGLKEALKSAEELIPEATA